MFDDQSWGRALHRCTCVARSLRRKPRYLNAVARCTNFPLALIAPGYHGLSIDAELFEWLMMVRYRPMLFSCPAFHHLRVQTDETAAMLTRDGRTSIGRANSETGQRAAREAPHDSAAIGDESERERLLTNREAAALLGVGVPTFYAMLKDRQLPPAYSCGPIRHGGGPRSCWPLSNFRAAIRIR